MCRLDGSRCPLSRGAPKEGFHCTLLATSESETGNDGSKHNSILTCLLTASILKYKRYMYAVEGHGTIRLWT